MLLSNFVLNCTKTFRHGTSIAASVANLVRPTTGAQLLALSVPFVYNTTSVPQLIARVRLR